MTPFLPPAETHQLDPEQRARKPARIVALCVGVAAVSVIAGCVWRML